VSEWVITVIVNEANLKARCLLLTRFIEIAQYCFKFANYNTVYQIISALSTSSVSRLKNTWQHLSEESKEIFANLSKQLSSSNNFGFYRQMLLKQMFPCCPYLGVVLSDLTFIDEGNKNYLDEEKKMVNWVHFSFFILFIFCYLSRKNSRIVIIRYTKIKIKIKIKIIKNITKIINKNIKI
jgi:hypothetical protein